MSLARLLYRRKALVAPLLVVAALSLVAVYRTAPPTYRVSSSFVLLSPPQTDDSTDPTSTQGEDATSPRPSSTPTTVVEGNPYLRFGDLSVVVDIVARVLRSPPAEARLRAAGAVGTWTVGANVTFYNGPIIDVVVEAPSSSAAIETAALVVEEAQQHLDRLQTEVGADPATFINTATVVAPNRATTVFSSTLRRLIAVATAEVLALLGLAVLADYVAGRRAERRRHRDAQHARKAWLTADGEPVDTTDEAVAPLAGIAELTDVAPDLVGESQGAESTAVASGPRGADASDWMPPEEPTEVSEGSILEQTTVPSVPDEGRVEGNGNGHGGASKELAAPLNR